MVRKKQPDQDDNVSLIATEPSHTACETEPVQWWDARGLRHPMNDAEFVHAFCEYVLATTDDHSLRSVRNRAFRFIRNVMSPDLEKALTAYRAVHP